MLENSEMLVFISILYKMKPKAKAAYCVSRHTVHKISDP